MDARLKSTCAARTLRGLALLCRRFRRASGGSAAIEFAMVATPFFLLVFAILQTSIVFFAGQTLETAAANVSRLILTGQAQTAGWSAAQFKTQVCNQIYGIFNCNANVYVDVETYASFASANLSTPVVNGNFDPTQMGYNPGSAGSIVVLRLYYQYPVYISLLGLSNLNGGLNLLAATAVFRNEAY